MREVMRGGGGDERSEAVREEATMGEETREGEGEGMAKLGEKHGQERREEERRGEENRGEERR